MLKNGQIYFCGAYNVRLLKYVRSFFNILHEGLQIILLFLIKKLKNVSVKTFFKYLLIAERNDTGL